MVPGTLPYSSRLDLALLASEEGILLLCSHVSREKAERMVRFLHQNGVDLARVVDGPCTHD